MIKLTEVALAASARERLEVLQEDICFEGDKERTYADRVELVNTKWKARDNRQEDRACFDEVKKALKKMCQGAQRCAYCEDSCADEIEHIKPKSLYPELTFVWMNYLYACGPCNGAKRDRFSVFKPGSEEVVSVARKRKDPVTPPVEGEAVFIDPRREDPMDFFRMDILQTFRLTPRGDKNSADPVERRRYLRARTTLNDLKLAAGPHGHLPKARENAFKNFGARLKEIVEKVGTGASIVQDIEAFQQMDHWSVWLEIKRSYRFLPEFAELFRKLPEALDW